MTGKKRTEITIQTETIVFIEGALQYVCLRCRPYALMLNLDHAVMATSLGWREILSAVQHNVVHFLETREGTLFICRQSLLDLSGEAVAADDGGTDTGEPSTSKAFEKGRSLLEAAGNQSSETNSRDQ